MKKRLVIIISNPIQYHAPLYKVAKRMDLFDLHVIYHNDRGVRPYAERFSGTTVSFDNDLLSGGYSYEFLTRGNAATSRQKWEQKWLPTLEERVKAAAPDAVCLHAYNYPAHYRYLLGCHRLGYPVFLRTENEDIMPRPGWRLWLREAFLKWMIPRIDAFLYIGRYNKEFFLKRGVPEEKLIFVPYSADNEYFGLNLDAKTQSAIRAECCAEWDVAPSRMLFLNTCKHRDVKRPQDLIAAWLQANQNLGFAENASLIMVGDGPLNAEMRRMVSAAGAANVVFAGYLSQSKMRRALLSCDYLVNPAVEPWGCTLNEALPAALGQICSDHVVGWPDLVKTGENGFVHGFGNVDHLANILSSCSRHPEWLPGFAAKSRQIAQQYSYETCVKGFHEALERFGRNHH